LLLVSGRCKFAAARRADDPSLGDALHILAAREKSIRHLVDRRFVQDTGCHLLV
jgi:hypothetical protein